MFKKRKINNQNSIGYLLKDARQKTGLSLRLVGRHTKINPKYLEALEKDNWEKLPGEIYAKNFLNQYCEFLKIDVNKLNIDFNKIPHFKNNIHHDHEFRKKSNRKYFFNLPRVIKFIVIILILISVSYYILWQLNQIIQSPEIILHHPTTDLTLTSKTLIISGQTDPEVKIKINNEDITLDENNNFSQQINLSPGLNTIKIEGKRKYSKTTIIERKVVLE